jgi:hypothetical protein
MKAIVISPATPSLETVDVRPAVAKADDLRRRIGYL